jgi:hypothetical protein
VTTTTPTDSTTSQALDTIEMTMVQSNLSLQQSLTQQLQQQFQDALNGTDTDTDTDD